MKTRNEQDKEKEKKGTAGLPWGSSSGAASGLGEEVALITNGATVGARGGALASRGLLAGFQAFMGSKVGMGLMLAAVLGTGMYGLLSSVPSNKELDKSAKPAIFQKPKYDSEATKNLPSDQKGIGDSTGMFAQANKGGLGSDAPVEQPKAEEKPPADAAPPTQPVPDPNAAAAAAAAGAQNKAQLPAALQSRMGGGGGLAGGMGMSGGMTRQFDQNHFGSNPGKISALSADPRVMSARAKSTPLLAGGRGAMGQARKANGESLRASNMPTSEGQGHYAAQAFEGGVQGDGSADQITGQGAGQGKPAGVEQPDSGGPIANQGGGSSSPKDLNPPSKPHGTPTGMVNNLAMLAGALLLIAGALILWIGTMTIQRHGMEGSLFGLPAAEMIRTWQLAVYVVAMMMLAAVIAIGAALGGMGQHDLGLMYVTGGSVGLGLALAAFWIGPVGAIAGGLVAIGATIGAMVKSMWH